MKLSPDDGRGIYSTDAYCHLMPGDHQHTVDNGGGGYGNPLDHEAECVLNDVAERYVSLEQAEEVYSVVITGSRTRDELAVDANATETLRQSRRASARA